MSVLTLEGVIKQGQIQLISPVRLPEDTKVYVLIPAIQADRRARIVSPRLVHPGQASDFVLEVIEETTNANV